MNNKYVDTCVDPLLEKELLTPHYFPSLFFVKKQAVGEIAVEGGQHEG